MQDRTTPTRMDMRIAKRVVNPVVIINGIGSFKQILRNSEPRYNLPGTIAARQIQFDAYAAENV